MTTLDFGQLAKESHQNAKAKGFWDKKRNMKELFMLVVSELAEALEADRSGLHTTAAKEYIETAVNEPSFDGLNYKKWFEETVKDTFQDEWADTPIRLLDFAGRKDISIVPEQISWLEFCEIYAGHTETEQWHDGKLPENIGELCFLLMRMIIKIADSDFIADSEASNRFLNHLFGIMYQVAADKGFNLDLHILAKIKYNKTRDYLNGKKY
jgi:hypothetical protein